jgi:hypothetical protein
MLREIVAMKGTQRPHEFGKDYTNGRDAVYFEDVRTQTVDQTGARHVVIGFASMRITVRDDVALQKKSITIAVL